MDDKISTTKIECSHYQKEQLIEVLIEQLGSQVTNFAYTYVKDWGLAEDITQDVFLKVYKNIDTFRNEANIKTWIYQITANQSKDILKKKYFRTTILTEWVEVFIKANRKENIPEETFIQQVEDDLLAESILQLPISFREIIILHYYEELSTTEISELLKIKVATVKSRLQRGRTKLRNIMERRTPLG